jgi:ATP-dependent DNA helicase RecG
MDITVTEISAEQARLLLSIDENHFIDLKAVDVSPASITKAASGFGNTSGCEVYVGADESVGSNGRERTWRGFPNVEAANGLLQAIEHMAPLAGHYEATFLAAPGMAGLVYISHSRRPAK